MKGYEDGSERKSTCAANKIQFECPAPIGKQWFCESGDRKMGMAFWLLG